MRDMPVRNLFLLFLTALIWGSAFVAQSVGMDHMGPFAFNMSRSFVGGAALLPVIALFRYTGLGGQPKDVPQDNRTLLIGGVCCGIALGVASNLQQVGIQYTSVGKAGFITALYIVLVPLLGLFVHKKVGAKLWVSVAIAVVGLYLLCMTESLRLEKGDFYVLLCSLMFSFHIIIIDHFSPRVDGVKMSCIQFFVAGILSLLCVLAFEGMPSPEAFRLTAGSILYAGVLSSGVAYTLQIVGQKNVNPTVASLILSLESVISALSGWIILHQSLSAKELAGCALMFAAIVLAQLPDRKGKD